MSPPEMGDRSPDDKPLLHERTTETFAVPDAAASPGKLRSTLTILTGPQLGHVHELVHEETVLGRGLPCELRIDDATLSRRHCKVVRAGTGYFVEDLGSTNGTHVDGDVVVGRRALADGARIRLGRETVLKFALEDELEQQASRRLYDTAVKDPLVGLHNRRYLEERLRAEFAYSTRHGTPLSFLQIDVDRLGPLNERHGRTAGDTILRALGELLRRSVRIEDLAARCGAEEFGIVARGIRAPQAMILAERVRRSAEALSLPFGAEALTFTVSVGVATNDLDHRFAGPEALMEAADQALHRAKETGRNRCEHASL